MVGGGRLDPQVSKRCARALQRHPLVHGCDIALLQGGVSVVCRPICKKLTDQGPTRSVRPVDALSNKDVTIREPDQWKRNMVDHRQTG